MVTTRSYSDSRYSAAPGLGLDGVVRMSTRDAYGSGVLLFDGRAVLTVAHLFPYGETADTSVRFETSSGITSIAASKVLVHPSYGSVGGNNDLALVWLSSPAPVAANRYGLYRDSDEIGQGFVMSGYGLTGTGNSGYAQQWWNTSPLRLQAQNRFDAEGAEFKDVMGSSMGWSPLRNSQLLADFDNGSFSNDALGRLMNRSDSGRGDDEGMIAPGDSGSPAFIQNKVVGIASYTASLYRGSIDPDIDSLSNSSFGEIGAWQRVSFYQQWIDQSMRANYIDAPTSRDQVVKQVAEGSSGTSLVYFLLEFTGVRSTPDQVLRVDYTTRNGTAIAGSDYIATSGRLVIYPNESKAVLAVEVIGDTVAEPDETFYLDVTNPVGGSFGEGVQVLTAIRTIVNDDGVWLG
jgi:hypothetical protein